MADPSPRPASQASEEPDDVSAAHESDPPQLESDPQAVLHQDLARPEVRDAIARAAALFDRPLCTRCLGRLRGRVAKELDNPTKGQTIAHTLDYPSADDAASCPWCEGLFAHAETYARLAVDTAARYEHDTILVATRMHPEVAARERRIEEALGTVAEDYEPLKTELNRIVGGLAIQHTGSRVDFQKPDLLVTVDPFFHMAFAQAAPVFLYGRYRKHDRTIPQTKWPCNRCRGIGCPKCDDTGQMYDASVESLIAREAIAAYGATDASFHGSGREDIDALMLGTGRPFVLELKEPRYRSPRDADGSLVHHDRLETHINTYARPRVEIEGLRPSDKNEVVRIKAAAFDKAYRAHVIATTPVRRAHLEAAIHAITAAPIEQRTPQRVAHRRADKIRTRQVHRVDIATFEGDDTATRFSLDILAASGTYIKELVGGDDGRTQPSFAGTLEIPMTVDALDVVGVQGD